MKDSNIDAKVLKQFEDYLKSSKNSELIYDLMQQMYSNREKERKLEERNKKIEEILAR